MSLLLFKTPEYTHPYKPIIGQVFVQKLLKTATEYNKVSAVANKVHLCIWQI